ncbi:MAG: hypothetical protein ABJN36_17935 [Cyclobacteriaceae bacterium]
MDDIQFWLYLGFGLIYFIVRQMKKKKSNEQEQSPQDAPAEKPYKKPVTFEELLREFTGETTEEEKEVVLDDYTDLKKEENREEEVKPYKYTEDDHSHRRFADDESRKIYENSIKQAEGADLVFERDNHFKSKMTRKEQQEADSAFGREILESLQDADQAKKAVVLSEILNRKY